MERRAEERATEVQMLARFVGDWCDVDHSNRNA